MELTMIKAQTYPKVEEVGDAGRFLWGRDTAGDMPLFVENQKGTLVSETASPGLYQCRYWAI